MEKVKHTPGPWSEGTRIVDGVEEENYREIIAGCGYFDEDNPSAGFALSAFITPANARLIAAAPEMYETLQWIASQQDLFFAECSQAEEIVSRCAAAIKKARGE